MSIAHIRRKELDELRAEIQRLKAREKSLRAVLVSRRFCRLAETEDDPVERQLRQVFRQPGLFQRRAG